MQTIAAGLKGDPSVHTTLDNELRCKGRINNDNESHQLKILMEATKATDSDTLHFIENKPKAVLYADIQKLIACADVTKRKINSAPA